MLIIDKKRAGPPYAKICMGTLHSINISTSISFIIILVPSPTLWKVDQRPT